MGSLRLFKETPRLQKAFAKFGSVPVGELPSNADYNKQVALVADRLDNMIATMDDTLQIVGQINYMAYSHVPRNVDGQRFEVTRPVNYQTDQSNYLFFFKLGIC